MSKIEDEVCRKIQQRAEVGLAKYGVSLERTDLTKLEWLIHLQEELMDASGYLEVLINNVHGTGINEIAKRQHEWVERMGWHNKSVLESLALVASEVGEAVNECRGKEPTPNFEIELADIILRTMDLAYSQGIDLEKVIKAKMLINEKRGTRGRII